MLNATVQQLFQSAAAMEASGRIAEALAAYRQVVAIEPQNAHAWNSMGVLLHGQNDLAGSAECFSQASAARPADTGLLTNLVRVQHGMQRLDLAAETAAKLAALMPSDAGMIFQHASLLDMLGRSEEAIVGFRRAISLDSDHIPALACLASSLMNKGQWPDAIEALRRVIRSSPAEAEAHYMLAQCLGFTGQREAAIAECREAIRLEPGNVEWQFKAASLAGDSTQFTAAPASFIRAAFEGFAETFDQTLVDGLGYTAPAHLRELIGQIDLRRQLDIIDLGCGTGLLGVQFKSVAGKMVGVDLSPAMLAKAAAREIYDELIEADGVDVLRSYQAKWDLIIAMEVLLYMGDLQPLFNAASASLRDGGLFAFSIERRDGADYFLHDRARFAHSPLYIEKLAERCGLTLLIREELVLRKEASMNVDGILYVLKRGE